MAQIAGRDQGVIAWSEMRHAGLSPDEIKLRVRRGSLIAEFRGVYRVGHRAPSVEAHYMAAVKACGKGSVLRGRAAAHLWGLTKGPAPMAEVLTPTERRIKGIRTTRSRRIDRRDVTKRYGIPITTVARTVVDLAADSTPDELALQFHAAATRYKVKPHHVEAVLRRRRNAKGATKLRRVIYGDTRALLSELERGFIALLEANNVPLPKTNIPVDEHWVDCRWEEYALTIELESYEFHNTRHAWETDQKRERKARKRGDEYRRYFYSDVFEEPGPTLEDLRELLSSTRKRQRPTPAPGPARQSLPTAGRR